MSLNKNEVRIYEAIKEDPYVSQQELAKKMGLSRSYVAGILPNLVNSGYLLGRAYVLNPEKASILCIGRDNRVPSFSEPEVRASLSTNERATGSPSLQIVEGLKRLQKRVMVLSTTGANTENMAVTDTQDPLSKAPFVDDEMTPAWLYKNSALLRQAGAIVMDLDLPSAIREIIFTMARKEKGMLICMAPFGSSIPTISEIGAGATSFVATVDQS